MQSFMGRCWQMVGSWVFIFDIRGYLNIIQNIIDNRSSLAPENRKWTL